MSGCYVEAFRDDATGSWGWHCLSCSMEDGGYPVIADAEEAGDHHAEQVADFVGGAS